MAYSEERIEYSTKSKAEPLVRGRIHTFPYEPHNIAEELWIL